MLKLIKNLLSVRSTAHINWFTWSRRGQLIGTDITGNRYFESNPIKGYKRNRRWVLYNGFAEASKVPPQWHGWLHYQTDDIPSESGESYRKEWQKPHQENLTGTTGAYRPPGHILEGGQRHKATGDYEAWSPP